MYSLNMENDIVEESHDDRCTLQKRVWDDRQLLEKVTR